MPPSVLRVLLVEDVPADAELVEAEFARSGQTASVERVETEPEFLAALDSKNWDVIVSDYSLPDFDALSALAVYRARELQIPFIVVSGVLGEEHAVAIMRAGAQDYIPKTRLARVPAAVERARREMRANRAAREAKERELHVHLELNAVVENMIEGYVTFDADGGFGRMNRRAEQLFGALREVLLGKQIWTEFPSLAGTPLADQLEKARQGGAVEFEMDLPWSPISLRIHAYPSDGGVAAFFQDITPQKNVEKELREAVAVRETLLREVHHRVKNNMQVVCSLLRLQVESEQDERLRRLLGRAEERIMALADIHERLCMAQNVEEIDLGAHLLGLAEKTLLALAPPNITLAHELCFVKMTMDRAIPCGLILNELLLNCIRHAFPEWRAGEIRITLAREAQYALLVVADNGVGCQGSAGETKGLGCALIEVLAAQLGGSVEYQPVPAGTSCSVRFLPERWASKGAARDPIPARS